MQFTKQNKITLLIDFSVDTCTKSCHLVINTLNLSTDITFFFLTTWKKLREELQTIFTATPTQIETARYRALTYPVPYSPGFPYQNRTAFRSLFLITVACIITVVIQVAQDS